MKVKSENGQNMNKGKLPCFRKWSLSSRAVVIFSSECSRATSLSMTRNFFNMTPLYFISET